jgi:molybdopterin synthase catalytic subunit
MRVARLQVIVQEADFDTAALQQSLLEGAAAEGAVATFTGYVRGEHNGRPVQAMLLEHYPGMTEQSITAIAQQAAQRWPLLAASVVHRVGTLPAGDQIVWVGAAAAHRQEAFSACEFIMDYLKTRAPFWKKEFSGDRGQWVEARAADLDKANSWNPGE